MQSVQAYPGAGGTLHRNEADAIADIIDDCGRGTVSALLRTQDPNYQPRLQEAILRAAEIVQALRKQKRKR